MSLKRNILANYVSQFYVTLIGIIMVPLYIRYMGAEAYGLVGFFAMLQAMFSLLDMGLTPTIARESARFHGGATDALNYRRLVRALEGVFSLVALAGGSAIFAASDYIARDWLQTSHLSSAEVQAAVRLMAVVIVMRWISGLYRGIVSGSEKLVWLSGFNSIVATLRFVGVLPLLMFLSGTPTVFFGFQLGVGLLELISILLYSYRLLPNIESDPYLPWNLTPLKPTLRFSLTIAFTSSVWVLLTQTDKLVLSKILPLAEYGYFTVAVLVASSVMIVSGPISGALMPRMSKLEAEHDQVSLIRVYRQATQLVSVIAGATSITLAFCAEPLLRAWTGDQSLAQQAAPILILYALGNGILVVSAFPYYLQYAKGDLRLHFIGNAAFLFLLVPGIIWAANQYGGVGAGYVWLAMNAISFVAWLPLVHRRFKLKINLRWYGEDILVIFFAAAVAGYILKNIPQQSDTKGGQLAQIGFTALFVASVSAAASSEVRLKVRDWLARRQ